MASKITLFNHNCRPLAELNGVPTTPRSWVLNKYGMADFSLSTADPKCTQQNFQFGNLVHIEHIPTVDENNALRGKLPDWTGIILPPQTWDLGVLHVTAYGIEALLAFRAMPYITVKGTPRQVFLEILKQAEARANNIPIQPGTVDDLPLTFPDDLRTNALDHINKLIANSGMDWNVEGSINDHGNLELAANLYRRKGEFLPLTINQINSELTSTNTELQSPLLTLQGTPSNQVFGYSQAQTAQSRFSVEAIDQAAMDDYGPLQLNQVFIGKHDQASIMNSSRQRAKERARPVWLIKRTVLDYRDSFDNLAPGNIINVKETNVGFNPDGGFGFEKQARIVSVDYNDLSNKAPLNIEVLQ